ncbi:hypothetical protein [Anaeromicrobium sediminis]|uniref:Deacetylase PdaC domain-containing protein n=1 Tax=Anaeromicrobium sediminis TaxID=1478221 RepID=A0A267MJE0_9FIRM|nr:hypothetical protein [Anaeromicrobium sediminis]PAB59646.1 hypothetical protein CCE28_08755 [Anaeromicrobium sediminis]
MKKVKFSFLFIFIIISLLPGCTKKEEITYDIITEKIQDSNRNIDITYPQVKDYSKEEDSGFINSTLKKTADMYNEKDYMDVNVEHDITREDSMYLSVVYIGNGKREGVGEINIFKGVNMDLQNSKKLSINDLIKGNKEEELINVINEEAMNKDIEKLQNIEDLGFSLQRKKVLFFYRPSEKEDSEVIKLNIPNERLKNIVKIKLQ